MNLVSVRFSNCHASCVHTSVSDYVVPLPVRKERLSTWIQVLLPSLSDCLLIVFMLLLFSSSGDGWSILLADGDTGWHIRTGEHILATKAVPTTDSFSFTKTGDAWYAWEWAADVIFAAVHQYAGLRGLVFLSGTALCLSGVILFRYMLWRGAAVHVAVVISILVMEAAKIHFLARPHLFTLLLIPITMWMIDRDVQHPTRITWLLAPIAALWTNLHGGFLILLTTLIIFTSVFGVLAFFTEGELQKTRFRRFAWLSIACTLATFVNPYGYTLYTHIIPYLQSDWIKNMIQEFQSPQFRSESLRKFEFLLFLGLGLVPALFRRGSAPFAMLILAWAHAALTSVRHVPVYAFISAGPIATELTLLWNRWTIRSTPTSAAGIVRDLFKSVLIHAQRTSIWAPVFLVCVYVFTSAQSWPIDFPDVKFPAHLMAKHKATWVAEPAAKRMLSSDSWGGYLIYHLSPHRKVFMDGRSDFYGPELGKKYFCFKSACEDWPVLIDQFAIDTVLIPRAWSLSGALRRDAHWKVMDEDDLAVWFERKSSRN
jgi:hypothetical protein